MSSFNYKKAKSLDTCHWEGCLNKGYHKAPKNIALVEYFVFCLKHVRQYNHQWGCARSIKPSDMEDEYQSIATWERTTWRFSSSKKYARTWDFVENPFEINQVNVKTSERITLVKMSAEEKQARTVLGIGPSVSLEDLKKHYHKLVKQYHPDTNSHKSSTHNKMKSINNAYNSLKKIIINQ